MSVCDKAPELDLRQILKVNRTEISMAIDDLFPFLHGLVDHDIITEQIFKETLQLKEQKGSHKAVYAVLTWFLEKSNGSISEFWRNLFKDYNLERYPKLQSVYQSFSKDLELSKLRRGKKTLKVSPDQVAAKPLLKRKSPEELADSAPITHGKCASSKMTAVMTAKGRIARKTENMNIPRLPPRSGAQSTTASVQKENNHSANDPPASSAKGIFIKQVFESGISKKGIKVVGDAQILNKPEELGGKSKNKTWKMAARYRGITLGQLIGQKNDDECAICRDGGELICCDGCPRAFHLSCLVPPLTEIPTGTWRCFSCAKKDGDTRITLSAVPEKSQQSQSTAGVQMLLQTSENETLNPRCGVCKTSGDLKDCTQCQGTFHSHCNFSPTPDNMRSGRCNSCANVAMLNITTEPEVQQKPPATQMSLMAVDHEPEIDSFVNDHLLNKEELDSILREVHLY